MTSRYLRIRELFDRAEPLQGAERTDFLDRECGDDELLRKEVQVLLQSREHLADFLDDPPSPWRGRRIGSYVVESVIAEGGMGLVLRATQEHPRREVALKLVRGAVTNASALQRFELEAQVLGRLDHPGIARIFEAGTVDEAGVRTPFFAMELIDGLSLSEYVRQHDPSMRQRLELMIAVCEAVHHAHLRGVIHRDLKPSNILVGAGGRPKVLDFGVARITDADVQLTTVHTGPGPVLGTLPYMSPEQVQGQRASLDLRSDVYALGVLLFETLTGELPLPLHSCEFVEAARRITEERPAPLSRKGRHFASDLETIVEKCLRKEPERRYASAADLAQDLAYFLAERPIQARPTTARYHLTKFVRRNPVVVALLVSIVLVLMVGLSVSISGWTAARRSAEEANTLSAFLVEMLSAPDPFVEGRELRVVDFLERAGERAEEVFADRPPMGARVHRVLGDTYRGLGLTAAATKEWELALQRITGLAQDDRDPRLVEPLVDLGNLLLDQGLVLAADSLAVRVRTALERVGDDELVRYRAALFLGVVADMQGRFEEAVAILEPSHASAARVLGAEHTATVDLQLGLGNALWQAGEPARARVVLEQGLDVLTRTIGADHPATSNTLSNLAMVYRELGELELARDALERNLDAKLRVLGNDHQGTAIAHHNLADLLRFSDREAEAVEHHRAAVAIAESTATPDDGMLAIFQFGYGRTLRQIGRSPEAYALVERAQATLAEAMGPQHPRTRMATQFLIDVAEELARPEDAARWRASLDSITER